MVGEHGVDDDVAWVLDPSVVMFCLTCVTGTAAEDLLRAAGADLSDSLISDAAEVEALAFDRDALGVRVATVGEWSVLIEFQSLKGADPQWTAALSAGGGTAVGLYQTGAGMGGLSYAVDGELLTAFEPAIPAARSGSDPDRLVEDMRAVSLSPDGADTAAEPGVAAVELVARLTGLRLTDEVVRTGRWPAGFLPRRRRARGTA